MSAEERLYEISRMWAAYTAAGREFFHLDAVPAMRELLAGYEQPRRAGHTQLTIARRLWELAPEDYREAAHVDLVFGVTMQDLLGAVREGLDDA